MLLNRFHSYILCIIEKMKVFMDDGAEVSTEDVWSRFGITLHVCFMLIVVF